MKFPSRLSIAKLFIRFLSMCYGLGALIHLADLFDLNLKFSEMSWPWRAWIVYLFIADTFASIELWRQTPMGVILFQVIAFSQIITYTLFRDTFGNQNFLISFHLITLAIFYVLAFSKVKTAEEVKS